MAAKDFQLKILIVGAGMGGLSASIACALAGHKVTILEQTKVLSEVGAGLQITPNSALILKRWGLGDLLDSLGAEPTKLIARRYDNGKILTQINDFHLLNRKKFGVSLVDIHRMDLQKMLFDKAVELGVTVLLGKRVSSIRHELGQIMLESGETYHGDLIIGADGLWSRCRESLLNQSDKPLPTGDLAYRIVLDISQVTDPELREWIQNPTLHLWLGPDVHIVAYSMRSCTSYNMVLLCPDDLPSDVARQPGSVEEIRAFFRGWDPILTRFLDLVSSIDKWKLMHRDPVPRWTNQQANFALLGDACHPMLPYLAQGANSAIEDGAVLGRLLRNVTNITQLPHAVRLYESLRKARGEAIQRETFLQRIDNHLHDGPEQEARDALLAAQSGKDEVEGKFPLRWACPEAQAWLFAYDADAEADAAVRKHPFPQMASVVQPTQDLSRL